LRSARSPWIGGGSASSHEWRFDADHGNVGGATERPAELHLPVHEPGVLQRLEHQPVPGADVPAALLVRERLTPNLNPSLSLAENPVYSDGNTTVTIDLKPYKWSNGETVTARTSCSG